MTHADDPIVGVGIVWDYCKYEKDPCAPGFARKVGQKPLLTRFFHFLTGEDIGAHVDYVDVSRNDTVADADLALLKKLPGLKHLFLLSTPITNAGLQHLQGLAHLETLGLGNTKITDNGLRYLEQLSSLRQLSLSETNITDDGLKSLTGLSHLRELFLQDVPNLNGAWVELS